MYPNLWSLLKINCRKRNGYDEMWTWQWVSTVGLFTLKQLTESHKIEINNIPIFIDTFCVNCSGSFVCHSSIVETFGISKEVTIWCNMHWANDNAGWLSVHILWSVSGKVSNERHGNGIVAHKHWILRQRQQL